MAQLDAQEEASQERDMLVRLDQEIEEETQARQDTAQRTAGEASRLEVEQAPTTPRTHRPTHHSTTIPVKVPPRTIGVVIVIYSFRTHWMS